MRDILFRGKDRNGKWVEGDCFPDLGEQQHYIRSIINIPGTDEEAPDTIQIDAEIDPQTIGQYTGLKDSEGKKIFEGDIVEYRNNAESGIAEIEWISGGFIFRWQDVKNGIWTDARYFGCSQELKILGNIYDDNPELIKCSR